MLLHFTKMHGLGNDFMVVDLVTQRARLRDEQIRELADRRFGIGFDQLLVVEPPRDPDMDFRYRIYNADGSEVENCGNGARCFARFVLDQRLTHKREIHVETAGGPLTLVIGDDGRVSVDMGQPRFDPQALPFDADGDRPLHDLEVDGQQLSIGVASLGNPHAVLRVMMWRPRRWRPWDRPSRDTPASPDGSMRVHAGRIHTRDTLEGLRAGQRRNPGLRNRRLRRRGLRHSPGAARKPGHRALARRQAEGRLARRRGQPDHDRPRRARLRWTRGHQLTSRPDRTPRRSRHDPSRSRATQDPGPGCRGPVLARHPDFFVGREGLLQQLRVPHPEARGATSLLERLVADLRSRAEHAEGRLEQLLDSARHNEAQYRRTRELILALLEAEDGDAWGKPGHSTERALPDTGGGPVVFFRAH